ncbi:SCAR-like protein 1 [Aristolochia californica]|uniref:SCAR-like protein 1 n=1 Tax=Aristolochia californica TaxID=171875 RepID=UPI0035E23E95
MPISRYQIRNEYNLADPELYRTADRDDPEAILEGVAMAGLIGVLRQLGDLAEFAAEIFHDLHEEVMATSARGHGLMLRVQQLEEEFPSIEKAFLSQTSHSSFTYNGGLDWCVNLQIDENLVTRGDLPRFIMDSYEECRGPPRLFLLDKFDIAGAGACLKRYSDPSFFKTEFASSGQMKEELQREKKVQKVKKKGSRWKNCGTPEIFSASDFSSQLQQIASDEPCDISGKAPTFGVRLKKRHLNGYYSLKNKSYMKKILETNLLDKNSVSGDSVLTSKFKRRYSGSGDAVSEIHEIVSEQLPAKSTRKEEMQEFAKAAVDDLNHEIIKGRTLVSPEKPIFEFEPKKKHSVISEVDSKDLVVDAYMSDDNTSELENYVDALMTMESEMETDLESKAKHEVGSMKIPNHGLDSETNDEQLELQGQLSHSHSCENSSASCDWNNAFKKGRTSHSNSDTLSSGEETLQSCKIILTEFHDFSSETLLRNGEIPETKFTECLPPSVTVIGESKVASHMCGSDGLSFDFSLTESTFSGTNLSPGATELSEIPSTYLGASSLESSSNSKGMNHRMDGDQPPPPGILDPLSEAEVVKSSGFDDCDRHELLGAMKILDDAFSDDTLTVDTAKGYPSDLHFASMSDINHERVSGGYVEEGHFLEGLNTSLPGLANSMEEIVKVETSAKQDLPALCDRTELLDECGPAPLVEDINVVSNGSVVLVESSAMSLENSESLTNGIVQLSDAPESEMKAATVTGLDLDSNMIFNSCDHVELQSRSIPVQINKLSDVQEAASNHMEAVTTQHGCDLHGASQESIIEVHEQSTGLEPRDTGDETGSDSCEPAFVSSQETSSHGEAYVTSGGHNLLEGDGGDSGAGLTVHLKATIDEVQEQSSGLAAATGANIEAVADKYSSNVDISQEASSHQHFNVSADDDISLKGVAVDLPDQIFPSMVSPTELGDLQIEPLPGCMLVVTGNNECAPNLLDSSEASFVEMGEQAYDPATKNNIIKADIHDHCLDSVSATETTGDHPDELEICPSSDTEINLCKPEITALSSEELIGSDVESFLSVAKNFNGRGPPTLMPESCSAEFYAESESEFLDCVHNLAPVEDVQDKEHPSNESEIHVPLKEIDHNPELDNAQHNHGNEAVEDASEEISKLKTDMQIGAFTSHGEIEILDPLKEIDQISESVSSQQDLNPEASDVGSCTHSVPETTISSDQGFGQNQHAIEEFSIGQSEKGEILKSSEISNVIFGSKSSSRCPHDQIYESVSPLQDPDADVSDIGCRFGSVPKTTLSSDPGFGQKPQSSEELSIELSEKGEIPKSSAISDLMFESKSSSQSSHDSKEHSVSPSMQIVLEPEFALEESIREEEHNKSADFQFDEGQSTQWMGSCLISETQLGPNNNIVTGLVVSSPMTSVHPEPFTQLTQGHDFDNFESGSNPFGSIVPSSDDPLVEAGQQASSNTDEMPPLPPLPPLQWRMVKLPQDCTAFGGEAGPFSGLFPPFSAREEEQPPHDSLIHGRKNLDPTNPFHSISSVGDVGLVVSPSNPFPPLPKEEENNQNGSERQEFHPLNPFPPEEDEKHQNGFLNLEEKISPPPHSFALAPTVGDDMKPQHDSITTDGHLPVAPTAFTSPPSNEDEKPNGKSQHSRQKDPLIEAVAAHDRSKLKKASERVRPEIKPKVDERDSLLEQIRTKSFNLKPAVAARPIIQGPRTNLNVVAILEKAHAIRQAFAGSEEDDDADSWSDS